MPSSMRSFLHTDCMKSRGSDFRFTFGLFKFLGVSMIVALYQSSTGGKVSGGYSLLRLDGALVFTSFAVTSFAGLFAIEAYAGFSS